MNIVTGIWGDRYRDEYAEKLYAGIKKHLPKDTRLKFFVITHDDPGHPGWWNKLTLFRDFDEPLMWIDVDTLVVGDITPLWTPKEGAVVAPANWAQSGHGGIQSSLMVLDPKSMRWVWDRYDRDRERYQRTLHGDQEYLTALRDDNLLVHYPTLESQVKSYKYHSRGGPPAGASLVTFHGNPKPHEAGGWAGAEWQSL